MSIAFKEWALVCEALGLGAQSIILRKGGIAEGREGFRFKHPEFFLFPTLFHEQLAKTTLPPGTEMPAAGGGRIHIKYWARVEWTARIDRLEAALRLTPFHIWREEVLEERFRYDETPGLHLAFLRVFRLDTPWDFPDSPAYGGCRSWVQLPEPPGSLRLESILDENAHDALGERLKNEVGRVEVVS